MSQPAEAAGLLPLLAPAIPLLLALTAWLRPRAAQAAAGGGLLLATLFAGAVAAGPESMRSAALALGVRADVVSLTMLLLVAGLGVIVVRYSQTYLEGDPGRERLLRWLLLTLAAVVTLVVANHLLVAALAWTATSVALHQLLTYFPDRRAALVAAHKKFLVSRLADLCLGLCLVLVYRSVGSLQLDRVTAWASAQPELPAAMHGAAVLLVLAVALKSAQLPFHGWLIQVMEAPTPVSALLHAGVVNIGGFVLISLAPWLAKAAPAQLLLVALGLVSAVAASLIMTTRVSVKVALAWSTCAQMGFMLVQCGLGLWPLALLHLVAHSLYKAHAFLSAGSAVEAWKLRALAAPTAAVPPRRFALALLLAAGVGAALFAFGSREHGAPQAVLAVLFALAAVPLLLEVGAPNLRRTGGRWLRLGLVTALSLGAHALVSRLLPASAAGTVSLAWLLVAACFLGLFAAKSLLQLWPHGAWARELHGWLFAGLYLDEFFTRLTFRLWPPRLPSMSAAPEVQPLAFNTPVEVRA